VDRLLEGLVLQYRADVSCAALIHGALERIVFPAEYVVAVLRVAVPVDKRLRNSISTAHLAWQRLTHRWCSRQTAASHPRAICLGR
jgi:hypothetical protein